MRHSISLSLFIAAALAVPVEALAQPDNSHSLGRQIAIELCSSCHRVTEGQPLPRHNVASFFAIANLHSTTALSLKVFLQSNHKGMPNLIVSESDSNELIDYILSLKRR
jgi:mono/diheme cytochrome c family protein